MARSQIISWMAITGNWPQTGLSVLMICPQLCGRDRLAPDKRALQVRACRRRPVRVLGPN